MEFVLVSNASKKLKIFKAKELQRLQVPRPLTVSWNCDGTRLAAGAEKSVSVITFDSSFRIVSIYNISGIEDNGVKY